MGLAGSRGALPAALELTPNAAEVAGQGEPVQRREPRPISLFNSDRIKSSIRTIWQGGLLFIDPTKNPGKTEERMAAGLAQNS
jgi:hypothetical protein